MAFYRFLKIQNFSLAVRPQIVSTFSMVRGRIHGKVLTQRLIQKMQKRSLVPFNNQLGMQMSPLLKGLKCIMKMGGNNAG